MGMKSIEERAKEFAQNFEIIPKGDDCEDCDTCTKCNDYRRFVDIVTEQKNIDIDKAASWFGDYLTELRDSVNWFYGSSKMKSGKDRFVEAMKK